MEPIKKIIKQKRTEQQIKDYYRRWYEKNKIELKERRRLKKTKAQINEYQRRWCLKKKTKIQINENIECLNKFENDTFMLIC